VSGTETMMILKGHITYFTGAKGICLDGNRLEVAGEIAGLNPGFRSTSPSIGIF